MASEPLAKRATACEVLAQFGTSDHAPVVATFGDETERPRQNGRQFGDTAAKDDEVVEFARHDQGPREGLQ
jgi:hypothetical protein